MENLRKQSGRFTAALIIFGMAGQIAWVIENMFLNVFIYQRFNASASDIALMVAASAAAATLTTLLVGALSDRIGKRKLFICSGYMLWGVSITLFAFIRMDVIASVLPAYAASAASIGIALVIIMDCVMTFFGSAANDACFNAWLTDSTDSSNRGRVEGINAMFPLVAVLVVFGFDMVLSGLGSDIKWNVMFGGVGALMFMVGVLGIFLIKEPAVERSGSGYLKSLVYGFLPSTIKANPRLYLTLCAFAVVNCSIQVFMPYLILYYTESLHMENYVLVMAPAIVLAAIVTAFYGKRYDKHGFCKTIVPAMALLAIGYLLLFFTKGTVPVFIGSLLMMTGDLTAMAVFGAMLRDNTPKEHTGQLQAVRIVAQVLIPMIIGPSIGAAVLKNAATVVNSDGTESFIPNEYIFLAALAVAAASIVPILAVIRSSKPRTAKLTTKYEEGLSLDSTPWAVYPRPQMRRDSFLCLNGRWEFEVSGSEQSPSTYSMFITVPFPPESQASGVGHVAKPNEYLHYRREFDIEKPKHGRVILHFGAVDCEATVMLNGAVICRHTGGYTPFDADITDAVEEHNVLQVCVRDRLDGIDPCGKQRYKRGGMWYTPVSGIWQTVWAECVPQDYIRSVKLTPSLDAVKIELDCDAEGQRHIRIETPSGEIMHSFEGNCTTVGIPSPMLWTPEAPQLYPVEICAGEDRVRSYFALRTVTCRDGRICLNGKPYFFNGLLDQGYYSDGIYLPASPQGYEDDILHVKAMGFNTLRKHIKVEPQWFYYLCDKLGMCVFQDMVNIGGYSFIRDTALPTLGLKRADDRGFKIPNSAAAAFRRDALEVQSLLYNHPSVVYYTIFNEGWGQHRGTEYYRLLKGNDPSRIYDTASGWFTGAESDVDSEHIYFRKLRVGVGSRPLVLSEFGGCSCRIAGHVFNLDKNYGYGICSDTDKLNEALRKLYAEELLPLVRKGLSAAIYTQVSDVEDETNGLLTYDRRVVKADVVMMKAISEQLIAASVE